MAADSVGGVDAKNVSKMFDLSFDKYDLWGNKERHNLLQLFGVQVSQIKVQVL